VQLLRESCFDNSTLHVPALASSLPPLPLLLPPLPHEE
jgi:hypothetical protein